MAVLIYWNRANHRGICVISHIIKSTESTINRFNYNDLNFLHYSTSVDAEAVAFSVSSSLYSLLMSMKTNQSYSTTVDSGKVINDEESCHEEMEQAVTSSFETLLVSINTNWNYTVTVGSGKVIYHEESYDEEVGIAVATWPWIWPHLPWVWWFRPLWPVVHLLVALTAHPSFDSVPPILEHVRIDAYIWGSIGTFCDEIVPVLPYTASNHPRTFERIPWLCPVPRWAVEFQRQSRLILHLKIRFHTDPRWTWRCCWCWRQEPYAKN